MPNRLLANGRVKVTHEDNGRVTRISGKALSNRFMMTFDRYHDIYNQQGPVRMGYDDLNRPNLFAANRDGYIYDIETLEGYATALMQLASSLRRENALHNEQNNVAPVANAVNH